MQQCVQVSERSPSLADRRLAAWVKLRRIAEEGIMSCGSDDKAINNQQDLHAQALLNWFSDRMEDWKRTTAPELINGKNYRHG